MTFQNFALGSKHVAKQYQRYDAVSKKYWGKSQIDVDYTDAIMEYQ